MYSVGGGENGYVATHPNKPDIFYAGATNTLTRYDRSTGLSKDIQPYPRIVMGEAAIEMPERWSWNYPIVTTETDPDALYVGSQHLWKSTDEGDSWQKISGDLSRAAKQTMGDSGGPVIKDQDGPEIYGTIYAIAPSKQEKQTIWTGSDDGYVYLTRDGGASWENVTPPETPENTRIGIIETSYHNDGTAYLTGRRYEMSDRTPYIWKTSDFGKTWQKIVNGIGSDHFVYSICEDPIKAGLLFAGTEHGVYVSINAGASWSNLSLNLPSTPVTGIQVKDSDLAIATHGRSFWVLDNIGLLREMSEYRSSSSHLFKPSTAIRRSRLAMFDFYLSRKNNSVKLLVKNQSGEIVKVIYEGNLDSSFHRYKWNLRHKGATVFPNIILEGGNPRLGPWAIPGNYLLSLEVNGVVHEAEFDLLKDPRLVDVSDEDLQKQFDLALKIRNEEDKANTTVIEIRALKAQLDKIIGESKSSVLVQKAKEIHEKLSNIEKEIYQVKNQSPKDKIAFPIRLNDRLTGLRRHLERGDGAPPESFYIVYAELSEELAPFLSAFQAIKDNELVQINNLISKENLPLIKM